MFRGTAGSVPATLALAPDGAAVKHWQETSQILARAARLAQAGQQAAMATVVRIEGSAYRRPGAKMLVGGDGTMTGSVSGGCLEADVRETALSVIRTGVPRLLHYDTGADDTTVWGLGLGCNGSVDVFVQPATTGPALEVAARIRALLEGDVPFAVSTVVAGPADVLGRTSVSGVAGPDYPLAASESTLRDVGALGEFIEVLTPPPHLLVFGAGDDSIALTAYARDAGFRVTVVDHRSAYLAAERFPEGTRLIQARPEQGLGAPGGLALPPRSYAVVKTHSLLHDREWVEQLLASDAAYIGILGPHARTEHILQQAGPAGAAGNDRVFGPVGLELGADGAEQIAVSIVAELLAVRAGCVPRHLRERAGAIHAG